MKNLLKTGLATAAIVMALTSTVVAGEDKVLNIYNWYDYIGKTTIADFEKETGIKVNYDTFDSNEMLETKLLTGRSGYDIVVPASNFLARQIKIGIFSKIDRSKLSHYGNLDKKLLKFLNDSDPGIQFSVPYTWGTTGVAYNVKKIKTRMSDAPLDSWKMVLNPEILSKFSDCGVAMVDSAEDVVPAILNYLGKDPNGENVNDLKEVSAVLKSIRPHITHFKTSQIIANLASGDVCLALTWNGDASLAFARAGEAGNGVEIAYSIPKEGTRLFFDVFAIPSDASHPENAHKFINFMLRPKNIASVTNTIFFANANSKAAEFVLPEILEDPGTYPPESIRTRLYSVKPRSLKYNRALTRAWSNFKLGR